MLSGRQSLDRSGARLAKDSSYVTARTEGGENLYLTLIEVCCTCFHVLFPGFCHAISNSAPVSKSTNFCALPGAMDLGQFNFVSAAQILELTGPNKTVSADSCGFA